MAKTVVMPAGIRYQGELAATAASLKALDLEPDTTLLGRVSGLVAELSDAVATLEEAIESGDGDGELAHAAYACDTLLPAMLEVRTASDLLESEIADDLWPMPTYQEMLHIL
ncbi:MAG: hypothetical protein R2714_16885 [Microthrixaceae bacterium]